MKSANTFRRRRDFLSLLPLVVLRANFSHAVAERPLSTGNYRRTSLRQDVRQWDFFSVMSPIQSLDCAVFSAGFFANLLSSRVIRRMVSRAMRPRKIDGSTIKKTCMINPEIYIVGCANRDYSRKYIMTQIKIVAENPLHDYFKGTASLRKRLMLSQQMNKRLLFDDCTESKSNSVAVTNHFSSFVILINIHCWRYKSHMFVEFTTYNIKNVVIASKRCKQKQFIENKLNSRLDSLQLLLSSETKQSRGGTKK